MPGNNGDTDREICRAVREGKLDEAVVNEAADNVIDLALRTDLVFKDYQEPVGEIDGQKVTGMNCYPEMRDAHHLVAKAAADETCVLLKNDGTLPLKATDKVAVIGDFAQAPRYQGAGSSLVNCTKLDNFVDLKDFIVVYAYRNEPKYQIYVKVDDIKNWRVEIKSDLTWNFKENFKGNYYINALSTSGKSLFSTKK